MSADFSPDECRLNVLGIYLLFIQTTRQLSLSLVLPPSGYSAKAARGRRGNGAENRSCPSITADAVISTVEQRKLTGSLYDESEFLGIGHLEEKSAERAY